MNRYQTTLCFSPPRFCQTCLVGLMLVWAGRGPAIEISEQPIPTYFVNAPTTFTITHNGTQDYIFSWDDGGEAIVANDPVLLLMPGVIYTFVRASANHPFGLMSGTMPVLVNEDQSLRRGTTDIGSFRMANGLELSGNPMSQSETITWTPGVSGVMFYTCQVVSHVNMTGRIQVLPEPDVREMTLSAARDAVLYEHAGGSLANGRGEQLFAGTNGGGRVMRSLIGFDLSVLPEGARVIDAELRLRVNTEKQRSGDLLLHRVTAAWAEGPADADRGEGGGAASGPGDVTWIHRSFPTSMWATAGGDFETEASAAASVVEIEPVTWASAGLAADIQSMMDDPESNHGWLLKQAAESSSAIRLASRTNGSSSARPALTIRYVLPIAVSGVRMGAFGTELDISRLPANQVILVQRSRSLLPPDFLTIEALWTPSVESTVSLPVLTQDMGFFRIVTEVPPPTP